jgi:CYTH domain-containing protein
VKEIERQFLCRSVEGTVLDGADGVVRIRQGYLTAGDPAVRVRKTNDAWVLTVKSGGGLVRDEVEVDIDPESGVALMEMAGETRLEKSRYLIGPWELDVFEGKLDGLIVLELELPTEDAPTPPFPPGIVVAREVTGTAEYRNQVLAALSMSEARALVVGLYDPGAPE